MRTVNYARRFRDTIAELEKHPHIALTRAHVAPPASEKAIARARAALGYDLAPEVLDFYRSTNGVSIRWELAKKNKKKPVVAKPFEQIDDTNAPGLVNLMPIEEVFESTYEDVLWFDWMSETADKVKVGGARVKLVDFAKGLRPFDYYSEFRMAAFHVGGRAPSPPVLVGDDHGADWSTSGEGDFASYLDAVLATRGSTAARAMFMVSAFSELAGGWSYAANRWREKPPTLDDVVRWASFEREGEIDEEKMVAAMLAMVEGDSSPKAKRVRRELT